MGIKDLSEKLLMSYDDEFAEIWNNLGCREIGRIDPSKLSDAPTELLYVTDDNVPHNVIRDISKLYGDGVLQIAILNIENQSAVDAVIPLRVMLYNALSYWTRHRANKKMLPVLTRVYYFGYKERWKGPRSLKDMLEVVPELKKEFKIFGDYKIKVIEVAWLSKKERERLTGDFREIAELLRAARLHKTIRATGRPIKRIRALFATMNAVMGTEVDLDEIESKEGVTMENFLAQNNEIFLNRGIKLGEKRGLKLGEERGLKLGEERGEERASEVFVKKLHAMQMSEAFIAEASQLPVEKVREILSD